MIKAAAGLGGVQARKESVAVPGPNGLPPAGGKNELSVTKFDFGDDLTRDIKRMSKKHKVPLYLVQNRDIKEVAIQQKAKATLKQMDSKPEPLVRQRTTKYSFDSDESDRGMIQHEQHVVAKLKDKDYLKLYQMKNPMHDNDRECTKSLMCNLKMPNEKKMKSNPYLNKVPIKEPVLNLHTLDLLAISQITPDI
jgi:hypothetical protein